MFKTAKMVGLNSDTNAALALAAKEIGLFGIVFAEVEDAFSRTRQALVEAEDIFSSSGSPLPAKLTEVLNAISDCLKDAERKEALFLSIQEDQEGAFLYLLCQGESLRADLIRDNKQLNLTQMAEAGQLISGVIKKGDRIMLMTASLLQLLGEESLNLAQIPIDSLEEEIGAKLPEAEDFPVAAVAIDMPKEEDSPVEPSIPEIEARDEQRKPLLRSIPVLFLKKVFPRSKQSRVVVGFCLMAIVLAGVGFSYKNQKEAETQATFDSKMGAAEAEYARANLVKDSDMASAAKSLDLSRSLLAEAAKIRPSDTRVVNLTQQIEENSGDILNTFLVKDFPVWLDLNLIKQGLKANRLSLSHRKLLILDPDKRTLVLLTIKTKASNILAGEEKLGEAILSSLNGNVAWVFSKDKGVIKIEDEDLPKMVIKTDDDWGGVSDIYGFAGNIYLLDEVKGQIWKYLPVAAGYSEKREYLKKDRETDFMGAKRLQIDSSVWVLGGKGEILKFTQGVVDFFSYSGLDKAAKEPKSFFVADETDNLYLLDSGNSRLLVLDKRGVYQAQYQGDKFKDFADLVVDEREKKAYLLEGDKIYVIELK